MRYLLGLVVSGSAWLLKKALRWMVRKAMGPGGQVGGQHGHANPARGATAADASGGAGQNQMLPRKLVRDPICGVYLAEVLAIPLRDGGELRHFCSKACRDKYTAQMQRRAANG